MKRQEKNFAQIILANLRKIMNDRNLTQATVAAYADTSESQFSRILKGTVQLSLKQLENIARNLSMREIDIITYPDKYGPQQLANGQDSDTELLLQLRLKKEKKEQVMKIIFGENNIEILNG